MILRQTTLARAKLAEGGARDRLSGCLLWTGGTIGEGYGAVWLDGRSCLVHKVSYTLEVGPIAPKMVIAHTCDNVLCFEPKHLVQKSQRENMTDACRRGRMPAMKLNADQVREILTQKGCTPARALAVSYGVTPRTIYRIWAGESWGFL